MMIEEALKRLEFLEEINEQEVEKLNSEAVKNVEAYAIATWAVRKQMPYKVKKIEKRPTEWGSPYICPICGAEQTKTSFSTADGKEPKEMYTWCYGCGQKLDWKEAKE